MTEYLLRVAGGVVCAALGALTALYEVFYSNIFSGLPSIVVAFAACFGLTHLAWFTVGTRWAPVLAIVPWLVVTIAAVSQRPEGDAVILGNSWGGALAAVLGMVGFAVPFFRAVRPRRPAIPTGLIPPSGSSGL